MSRLHLRFPNDELKFITSELFPRIVILEFDVYSIIDSLHIYKIQTLVVNCKHLFFMNKKEQFIKYMSSINDYPEKKFQALF